MPRARVRRGVSKWVDWRFEPSYCRPPWFRSVDSITPPEAREAKIRAMQSSWFEDMISQPAYTSAPPVIAAADCTHERLFGIDVPPAVTRRRRDAGDSCDGPRWSPTDCPRPPSVDDFTRTHRNIHGDDQSELRPAPAADFNAPRTTILGPHILHSDCCPPGASTSPVINEQFELTRYNIIGPQKPAPLRSPARTDDFVNSKRNIFGPATSVSLRFPRRTSDGTHDHLFGTVEPPIVTRRRRDAGDSCPRWSPTDCPRPPSVDDFTQTHRNIHGDDQAELPSAPRADFNASRTTIVGPHTLPPVCCPPPGASTSPVINEQFQLTRYNIIGPQKPAPLRFPLRTDDFNNSKRNIFGPATRVPLRFPRRTSDFDITRRNVFGAQLPFSDQPHDDTCDNLFGKTILSAPRTVTPSPKWQQNTGIDVFSVTGRPHAPPRFQPRTEMSFGNTYSHLFGRELPDITKYGHRQVLL